MVSLTDSNAETTNAQPASASSGHSSGVAQDVLDLGRAVERQIGMALVDGRDHAAGVLRGVEEVGVGERRWRAPAATNWSTSARTAASSTARTRPS